MDEKLNQCSESEVNAIPSNFSDIDEPGDPVSMTAPDVEPMTSEEIKNSNNSDNSVLDLQKSEVSVPPCLDTTKMSKEDEDDDNCIVTNMLVDPPSWTMRLITSDRFNAPMAIEYLYSLQDKPSLTSLGKRIFDLPQDEVDFFLPQLMFMYVNKIDAASVTHAYIEERHNNNPQFTILCTWLLECFMVNTPPEKPPNHALMLRGILKSEWLKNENKQPAEPVGKLSTLSLDKLTEAAWSSKLRSKQDYSTKEDVEINEVEHEKNPHSTISNDLTMKELLIYEQRFTSSLLEIGRKLMLVNLNGTKLEKMTSLKIELQLINVWLPAPVWIPFNYSHTVVNICYNECSVLNSKEKVPYIIFVEVIRSPPNYFMDIPERKTENISPTNPTSNNRNKSVQLYHDSSDPSSAVFAEAWSDKKLRIRNLSNYGGHKDWDLIPLIVKFGEDLIQEAFAQQLLQTLQDIWKEEGVPLYVRPYKIICVGPDGGFIEPILDTLSLHQIKRHLTRVFRQNGNPATPTLKNHFEDMFGPSGSENYVNAQRNFIQSTAAYSLVSYFLQLKDRHNGNILLDLEGHLIHIDYGFLLSSSPKNLGFETAPFKLTTELIDVMGGLDSDMFLYFKSLLLRGLMAAKKHHRRIISLAEIMSTGSKMPCFRAGSETIRGLEARFHVSSTDEELQQLVDALVNGSRDSYTTRFYDSFQYYTNGIH